MKVKGGGPGPGQYDADKGSSSTKFSIGSRLMNNSLFKSQKDGGPGPGAYDENLKRHRSPEFSLRGKTKEDKDQGIPGPGQY